MTETILTVAASVISTGLVGIAALLYSFGTRMAKLETEVVNIKEILAKKENE